MNMCSTRVSTRVFSFFGVFELSKHLTMLSARHLSSPEDSEIEKQKYFCLFAISLKILFIKHLFGFQGFPNQTMNFSKDFHRFSVVFLSIPFHMPCPSLHKAHRAFPKFHDQGLPATGRHRLHAVRFVPRDVKRCYVAQLTNLWVFLCLSSFFNFFVQKKSEKTMVEVGWTWSHD